MSLSTNSRGGEDSNGGNARKRANAVNPESPNVEGTRTNRYDVQKPDRGTKMLEKIQVVFVASLALCLLSLAVVGYRYSKGLFTLFDDDLYD